MVATKGYQSRDRSTSTTRAEERAIEVVVSVSGSGVCAIREGGGLVERKGFWRTKKGRSQSQKVKPATSVSKNCGRRRQGQNKQGPRGEFGGSEGRGWQYRQRQTGFTVEGGGGGGAGGDGGGWWWEEGVTKLCGLTVRERSCWYSTAAWLGGCSRNYSEGEPVGRGQNVGNEGAASMGLKS